MRIAYLVSQYPAPSHTFIRREVEALRKHGLAIETYSVRRPAASTGDSARDRGSVNETFYILPPDWTGLVLAHATALFARPIRYLNVLRLALRHRPPGMRSFFWALFYFVEAIFLARELEQKAISHLHSHFANAGATVGLLSSKYLNLPWSLTLHGISETDYPAGLQLGAKIEAARFVACVSYFGRAQAMRLVSPEQWPKLIIVRCALNLEEIPDRVGKASGQRPQIVSVGRLSPEKGQVGLLQAFASVRSSGFDADLIIVGDGPERVRIEHAIDTLNLRANVVLTGRLSEEETLNTIAGADIFVLSSFIEGLPVVLMEAMALSVPVIASRVAGIPELITDNDQGLLFCPTDWNELARSIVRLLNDPKLRERLGNNGRKRIKSAYEIGRAVEPLIENFVDART